MQNQIRTSFLFYTFTLFLCFSSVILMDTGAQDNTEPIDAPATANYTFETIEVEGVDFLAITASSDFEDYAGYTKSADGEKEVAFTLIDGVFTTYDFPGSQKTHFYALGNNGNAAGHYQDSEGLFHGIVLENGELRQYDFPGSVETEIYGISDTTDALSGNFIDASGIRHGFSGWEIIEYPGALETYADFTTASGHIGGSYIDTEGRHHAYVRYRNGDFHSLNPPIVGELELFRVHGINDAGLVVFRAKAAGDILRSYVSTIDEAHELRVPGSVITEGWNINTDGSVVGFYESADGRVHGFFAKLTAPVAPEPIGFEYTYESIEVPGVDFLAVTSSSDFEDYGGYTWSSDGEKIVAFTLIDGEFKTYEYNGSQNTRFYALGNNGQAAGHYEDSEGLYHGVVLENGELRRYDFPGSVQTEIYGISDSTGALTGNFIDNSGVRRGFSGDVIIEAPGASATYADFVDSSGNVVGSYVDNEGAYHGYLLTQDGRFITTFVPPNLDYAFVHGVNDTGLIVLGFKVMGDIPRSFVALFDSSHELQYPGSVSTEGYNINQDGSVVGYYDLADGSRHGFIARPVENSTGYVETAPVIEPLTFNYTFESIDVPGVEFLEVTASNKVEDYAGNTRSPDGDKIIGFTLIDGVFKTYDFPGSKNTFFYALSNAGIAVGHFQDSDGLNHGVILVNDELQQYDFPGAVQTSIHSISATTGELTGNFVDTSGVHRGFSGNRIFEYPGAVATYTYFVDPWGNVLGSYIDVEGKYHVYLYLAGNYVSVEALPAVTLEYFSVHGMSETGISILRYTTVKGIRRSYVSSPNELHELRFPGSVRTEAWNINLNGTIVGSYDSTDGRRHGFIARPASQVEAESYSNAYTVALSKGLNMLSVPLAPPKPMTAKNLVALTGATTIITLDTANQQFTAWTPSAPDNGFAIEGGKGYIVNVPQARNFAFVGAPWMNPTEVAAAAPTISTEMPQEAWAFVVSGHLKGTSAFDGYQVSVRNLRTNSVITAPVQGDYFAAATADLTRRSVVQVGDVVEVRVIGPGGNAESQTLSFTVTPEDLANAVLSVRLDSIGQPTQNLLLQNYPNPFNPETWIPYQLSEDSLVSVSIYDTTGQLVRTLSLGFQSAGFYNSQGRAAYWDGRNALGERVASGIYFYQLTTPFFQQTRRLVIVK